MTDRQTDRRTDRRTNGHPKPIGPQPFGLGPKTQFTLWDTLVKKIVEIKLDLKKNLVKISLNIYEGGVSDGYYM